MPVLYLVEQGATLRKEGDLFTISKDGQTLQKVPAVKVEQVVVLGNVNLTTPIIHHLLKEGIDCVFCSSLGRYHGRLFSTESGFGELRQSQLRAVSHAQTKLRIAREIVRGKLLNQRTLLMRYQRERPDDDLTRSVHGIGDCLDKLDAVQDVGSLLGLEGQASALYYRAFKSLLKQEMGFVSRVRRPPTDPVNSLLSFGYTLLGYSMQAAVQTVGLDPFLGFLHGTRQSRPSMVLDLIEEFRAVVVDSVVLRAINTRAITAADFQPPEEDRHGVFLTEEGIRKFLQQFEERVQTRVLHPQTRLQVTYRRCFELQARCMARTMLSHEGSYLPFLVK